MAKLSNSQEYPVIAYSIGITLVDVHLNWLNWFYFLIIKGSLLVILIDCLILLSPFLDVTRMSMSTVSFLTQLDSRIDNFRVSVVIM